MDETEDLTIFRNIVMEMADGIIGIDETGHIRLCNSAAETLFGWGPGALLNKPLALLLPRRFQKDHDKHVAEFAAGSQDARYMGTRHANILGIRADGTEIILGATIVKTRTSHGTLMVAVVRDLSERMQYQQELEKLANTDPLSGMLNRRAFTKFAEEELAVANRNGSSLALALFDLDLFKLINDNHGHDIGDIVICEFSDVLKTSLRSCDFIARWGGEEFIALLPRTSLRKAVLAAERIRQEVESRLFAQCRVPGLHMTTSAGVVCCNGNGTPLSELVRLVDCALYSAKSCGRNRVVASQEALDIGLPGRTVKTEKVA